MRRDLTERELTSEGPGPNPPRSGQRSVTVNLGESPLTWLHARGLVSHAQFAAAEQLRADWESAQLSAGVTMRWDPVRVRGSGGAALTGTERQVAARARFDGALAAAGSGLEDILWRVVCAGETLPDAERELAWPVRSGKLVLKLALDRVAAYYRISDGPSSA